MGLRDEATAAYKQRETATMQAAAKQQALIGHELTTLLSTILGFEHKKPLESGTTVIDGIEFQAREGTTGEYLLFGRLVRIDGTDWQHVSDQYRIDSLADLGGLIKNGEV